MTEINTYLLITKKINKVMFEGSKDDCMVGVVIPSQLLVILTSNDGYF